MNCNTISDKRTRAALHVAAVATILAAVLFVLSSHSFAAASPDATGRINASGGAYLRKSASTASAKLDILEDNTKVTIYREVFKSRKSIARKKVWYYVKAEGKKGYVRSDLVDNVKYSVLTGKVTAKVNYRRGAGTKMKRKGSLKKGTNVKVYLDARPVKSARGSHKVWYKIYYKGSYSYVCSKYIKITGKVKSGSNAKPSESEVSKVVKTTTNAFSKMTNAQFENYLTKQGFPAAYKKSLRALHKKHPNWVFVAYKTGLDWNYVMRKETAFGESLVYKSYPKSYRSTSKNSFKSYSQNALAEAADIPAAANSSDANEAEVNTGTEVSETEPEKSTETEEPVVEPEKSTATEESANVSEETIEAENEAEESEKSSEDSTDSDAKVSVFEQVRNKLDESSKSSDAGNNAEPITGTVIPDTISVFQDTESGAAVLVELNKNSNVTIKEAKGTEVNPEETSEGNTSSSLAVIQWYKVEFDASQTAVLSDEDAEMKQVYVDEDQSEDSDLEAENEAIEKEILGSDTEDNDSTDTEADSSEEAEESSSVIDKNGNITGYVRAEDICVASFAEQNAETVNAESEAKSETNAEKEADENRTSDSESVEEAETVTEVESDEAKKESAEIEVDSTESEAQTTETKVGSTEKEAAESDSVESETESLELVSSEALNKYYQVEKGWYNANANVVAYYLDPRNFLNEDRIYMFENLGYQSEYQTKSVVNKIISGTKLAGYGFNANVFMSAGKKYKISPVFLAARVRQETGGSSASVNGSKSGGKVVYNPFNIGAYGSDPVSRGLAYARKMGWTTPAKAVNGGAKYLASGYISKKQNTIYFQKFNVANGLNNVGTHQYMTNIMAPYSEAHITKTSYSRLGITGESLGFIIPVYKNMPSRTTLPE